VPVINSGKLRDIIRDRGMKFISVADELGMTRCSLERKINNQAEFRSSEVIKLCSLLNITDVREKEGIFFADEVD